MDLEVQTGAHTCYGCRAMAKKKSKGKKKRASATSDGAHEAGAAAADAETVDDDEQSEDSDGDEGSGEPESAARKAQQDPGAIIDSTIPRPDGRRSDKGGLIFVLVILGLVALAIVAQLFMGG